ncbi:kinase-like domain-containing protein [Chaetomium fimeti]|uniref:Kinase-like domain-containing protein n=1 Tax=Chaetomium fimeti TaxID=1854472 RepID=A0AAE0HNV5_9PEZI|nr:kinase-like domain-containing protein [Chaetomium fimeti]
MNPYEANPERIPLDDRYADVPFYGRYHPTAGDFQPDPAHFLSTSPEAVAYWSSVLSQCDKTNRIYENLDGGRDVFALGRVIVKSCHLHPEQEGRRSTRDYSLADENEVVATAVVRRSLSELGIRVPQIYFAGKIDKHQVFVQERIPGVGLNIAWQYISKEQKKSFKNQAREVLRRLQSIPSPAGQSRSYAVPDPNPVKNKGIQELEEQIIFSKQNADSDIGFMHNDFSLSNTIVDNDRIVGLVDWEMAGWFGRKTAADVHVGIRTPKRENFASLALPEDFLQDILFWNDLYEDP